MSMEIHQKVLKFINHFTNYGKSEQVIDCFTKGNCYYFAICLSERFYNEVSWCRYVYDPIANHWACDINGRIYDITGELTDTDNFVDWIDFVNTTCDEPYFNRLYENCIKF